jgi:hypothetical protein
VTDTRTIEQPPADHASLAPGAEHDVEATEAWLRAEVAATHDEMMRDPSVLIDGDKVLARLRARRSGSAPIV